MIKDLLVLLIVFLSAAISVAAVLFLTKKFNLYDSIDDRKIHTGKVPRLGGIGIFIGFLIGVILFQRLFDSSLLGNNLWTLAAGSALIFIMGVWDDLSPWKARLKLLAQCVAAILVLCGNFTFSRITFGYFDFVWDMGVWKYPLTFVWIIGVTNAFNLIDGLDGLAGGLAILSSAAYAIYFANYGNMPATFICLILALSVCGFMIFNAPLPKAKIFMGDGGSQFLGFVLSVLPLMHNASDGFATIALPYAAAILMIPLYDMIAAIWRRLRERRRIDSPDRFHLHHKLILMGFSPRESLVVILFFQVLICIFVSCAVWIHGIFAPILLLAVYLMGLLFFSIIHFRKKEILLRNDNNPERT